MFRVTVLAGVLDGGGFFDGMMSVVSLFLSLGLLEDGLTTKQRAAENERKCGLSLLVDEKAMLFVMSDDVGFFCCCGCLGLKTIFLIHLY